MKTTAFGISGFAIVFFTILAVLQLCAGHTRATNLQDNLQQALEASMKTAMDSSKSYAIDSDDELVADILQGIAMRLDDNCELRLEVNELDRNLGILSVKVTAYYMTQNLDTNDNGDGTYGDGVIDENDTLTDQIVSEVTAEHTLILEQFDMTTVGKHTITYQMEGDDGAVSIYKKYTLTKGVKLMVPKDPVSNFDGHWYLGDDAYTPAEIKDMDLDQDYTFRNKPE